ncbi:lipoprotein [Streptococcus sanguinis SK1 = NCTC 7863]|uniref:Lipoprotein n=1 Tax=Streptococcus sanguinis SK405 TaxID=888817 RepID=A0ABC9PDU7_STRSA|nr:hypothetical protein [Streptococcus sanguinis]EGC25020.1 hypothetical protein HMPREF9390_0809 [Streptococcus sanguinis SK405]EGF07697.1 lipoprotein [Streptococcus sanguinis SK1 = NCTC 7863]MBZ2074570.1 hypothetical protein [Streptococcus sanguinis]MCY7027365.1 hypothetical protein [Streptococcus sanguinis]SQG30120.1 lipoprotein [Streptococcus sanguinis]
MVKKRKIATLSIVALTTTLVIGGTIMTVQNKNLFTDGTKQERKEEQDPHEKQLDYLKEHEEEIIEFVKSKNPKIESVQLIWDSLIVEEIGNGTPQGAGFNLSLKGTFNHIKDSDFTVDFPLENENAIPSIDLIGMLNPPSVLKNGGWDKYE